MALAAIFLPALFDGAGVELIDVPPPQVSPVDVSALSGISVPDVTTTLTARDALRREIDPDGYRRDTGTRHGQPVLEPLAGEREGNPLAKTDSAGARQAMPPAEAVSAADRAAQPPAEPASTAQREGAAQGAETLPASPVVGWAVQVGSFSEADRARELRDRLRGDGFDAMLSDVKVAGRPVTRVVVGPFDRLEANKMKQRLASRYAGLGLGESRIVQFRF